jgi:RNA polymerase sigma-70 factor, ECF subfamily
LVRAWRAADRFDPSRGSMSTWLYAIARNLVIDQHRRHQRDPELMAGEPEGLPDDDASSLERALEAWQVADALARLSEEHRAAIIETYYRGASISQAARSLGVPPGTVKSRLHYGLRSLRLVLEERGVVG